MRAVSLTTVVLLAACSVDLPDEPGKACDATHPCEAGRDCIAGICVNEGSMGGGGGSSGGSAVGGGMGGGATGGGSTGGGTAGGGMAGGGMAGGSAGGGMVVDAGRVVWRQTVDGFTGETSNGSATCDIRLDAGNEVVSIIYSPDDTIDRASANMIDAGHLPQTGNGRLKGKFRLPVVLSLKGNSTFLRLENQGSMLVQLSFNTSGQLVVRSDTGFIGPMGYTQTLPWPGGFAANTDYTVDIGWKRGQYRSLVVNGIDGGVVQATDPGTAVVPPDQLRVGIYRYDADAGIDAGWQIIMHDWALADDPAVPL